MHFIFLLRRQLSFTYSNRLDEDREVLKCEFPLPPLCVESLKSFLGISSPSMLLAHLLSEED